MVKKTDRRKRDIKTKLMAAICMLMVSCIMVISSTYAWFTLSTAPEVTGISTAVGANGNLEMALLPSVNGDAYYTTVAEALNAIVNASGSLSTTEANITWGNLVDLSDASYGLDKITLYPSTLEITGTQIPSHYLSTPKYGADGRFSGLGTSAFSAIHTNGSFSTNSFGVRAIGTSSGMSGLEIAYRDALSAGNTALAKAIEKAKDTVSTGGSTLASMAVTKATNAGATYSLTDINALILAYQNMNTTAGHIETALRNYIIADFLTSGDQTVSETTYSTLVDAMKAAEMAALKTNANDTMDGYIENLATLRSTISTNLSALNTLIEGKEDTATFAWGDISTYVTPLANIDAMMLNSHPMSYWMEKDGETFLHLGDLVSQMKNLVMEVNKTGNDNGLFAQLADFIDDFNTTITINGISYNGISANGLEVSMKIYASADTAYLPDSKTEANTYTGTPFGAGGGTLISDFYGYIIDMGFRTNAAGSALQIQTEAVDRIYADNESNPATMGGGSSMTFTVPASGFDAAKLANLMTFIRVVYFDPADLTVFCEARLDVNTAVNGTDTDGNTTVTMQLKKWNSSANDGKGAWSTNSTITTLDQNVAKAVSAMVYLDGVEITNADVANVDLTGKMNLQFSSSAELKPMEYGELREGSGTENTDTYSVKVNGQTVSGASVNKGASYSLNISSYLNGQTPTSVVVTVGGQEVVGAYDEGTTTISLTDVQGDIEVTIEGLNP